MAHGKSRVALVASLALLASPAAASGARGFEMSVLVDGAGRPEYVSGGTVYVEALRGRNYAIRLTNPLNVRVAVALSVDGLNTIDARHTDAWGARKWVLAPYESVVISGWQINDRTARRFTFTGERQSYGAALGQTQNLGVIEAVFYRERAAIPRQPRSATMEGRGEGAAEGSPFGGVAGAPREQKSGSAASEPWTSLSDEYAATGMGRRTPHDVELVSLDLESQPVATARVRYEFRRQLVTLGILPADEIRSPLSRRETARGFESYCPEPR